LGQLAACAAPQSEPPPATTQPASEATAPTPAAEEALSILPADFDLEGHRGARGLQPENTLPAFETALDLGVDTLELDLHLSADGALVIWHDDFVTPEKCRLDASGDNPPPDPDDPAVTETDLRISHLTLEQLKQYRCDRNPDPQKFPDQNNGGTPLAGDDYRLATLDELFDFVDRYAASEEKGEAQRNQAARVQFNVETKRKQDPDAIGDDFDGVTPGAFEIAIVALIEERGLVDRTIIQSFDHRSLWAAHTLNEDIRLAALTSKRPPDLDEYAAKGAAIWSPRYKDVTPDRVQKAHDLGLLVIPWTVDDLNTAQTLIDLGVDGLITDRPDLFLSDQ
jgi:glycerophosphoryl diester phosphodiesterase